MTTSSYPSVMIRKISTHTLTWSVTTYFTDIDFKDFISTHTLTWSVTEGAISDTPLEGNFNSHAHVERDELTLALEYSDSNFNSHAHVERDYNNGNYLIYGHISTHTLTWSVTQDVCQLLKNR